MPALPSGGPDCRAVAATLSLLVVAALLAVTIHDPALSARLVVEDSVVEWLQVVLVVGAGVLALQQGRAARREGRPATLEVGIVAAMAMICIGEIDLDRMLFGTKVIATRFFVNPRYPLAERALAVTVIVGVPAAIGVWLLIHVRQLWQASLDGLRQPWGQTAAFGMALFLVVEIVEKPLNNLPWFPRYFVEETLELVCTVCIFGGLVARRGAIMKRMPVRSVVIVLLALGFAGCRGEHPAAAQDTVRAQARPPREVRVVPAAGRELPRIVTATGTLAAEEQITLRPSWTPSTTTTAGAASWRPASRGRSSGSTASAARASPAVLTTATHFRPTGSSAFTVCQSKRSSWATSRIGEARQRDPT